MTGVTIRDCLVENGGRIYPYAAWNFYRNRITEDEKFGKKYIGTYQSFYRYFYILENLSAIRKSGPPQHDL
ncbi:MAG: hypothetical protein SYNGOMJ08_00678 [Candidatus Syntrophoarchaeum sp. GoM_oil]|nr:MAG: hypothetical protein SYNGOMJ08_00678 [Candidatus Syntrophoarchaeum sp. GoM_oil]